MGLAGTLRAARFPIMADGRVPNGRPSEEQRRIVASIGTLNEGHLHASLRATYVEPGDQTEVIFEPSAPELLGYLLRHYLNIYLYFVLLNAKASEQSARMVSMKNATDNANDLIKDLTLEYNKLRQGNITKELLEIAGGQAQ